MGQNQVSFIERCPVARLHTVLYMYSGAQSLAHNMRLPLDSD